LFSLGVEGTQVVYAAPPANDEIQGAVEINSLTFVNTLNTTDSSIHDVYDPSDNNPSAQRGPCVDDITLAEGFKSAWYIYTPPEEQSIQADTIGSVEIGSGQPLDTYIVIWEMIGGDSDDPVLALYACNDDYPGNVTSRFTWVGEEAATYYIEVAQYGGELDDPEGDETAVPALLKFNAHITNVDVNVGSSVDASYYVVSGTEERLYYEASDGPVIVESLDSLKSIAAIRLQSYASGKLHSFVETMGVPEGSLSSKYYFPTYNNTWELLNSQLRFGNLNDTAIKVKVTIGSESWIYDVPANTERREYLAESGGPVIIESLDPVTELPDPTKKIVAAIRLQSYANGTLYSFAETLGIPAEQLASKYYFPTYNNTWAPLNSQLRFGLP
jgi:hypothetical protein